MIAARWGLQHAEHLLHVERFADAAVRVRRLIEAKISVVETDKKDIDAAIEYADLDEPDAAFFRRCK